MNSDVVEQDKVAPVGGTSLRLKSSKIIQQIFSFISSLANTGATPSMPTYQSVGIQSSVTIAPRMGEPLRINIFCHSWLGPIIIGIEYYMLTMFLNMRPHAFIGFDIENAFDFIINCYKRVQKQALQSSIVLCLLPSRYKVIQSSGGGLYGMSFTKYTFIDKRSFSYPIFIEVGTLIPFMITKRIRFQPWSRTIYLLQTMSSFFILCPVMLQNYLVQITRGFGCL